MNVVGDVGDVGAIVFGAFSRCRTVHRTAKATPHSSSTRVGASVADSVGQLTRDGFMTSLRPRALVVACASLLATVSAVALPVSLAHAAAGSVRHAAVSHSTSRGIAPKKSAEGDGQETEKNGHYCDGCVPPLTYLGGPVMDTTGPAGITITPIYWAPPDAQPFPPDYPAIINGYIDNVAAASGSTSNTYSVTTEYYQELAGARTNLAYQITAGTPVVDPQPFPADGCQVLTGYDRCIVDGQLVDELARITAELGLPTDLSHFYPMFFPPGVMTTDGTDADSVSVYCAYHSAAPSGDNIIVYGNEPYEESGCDSGQAPNGNVLADAAVSVLSHEVIEAMTDPADTRAWNDAVGDEIADICSNDYGEALGSTDPNNASGTQYNQVINGANYYIQTEFSNRAFATLGMGQGCIQNEDVLSKPVPVLRTAVGAVFTEAYPNALTADGASSANIDTLVTDRLGDVKVGDLVSFSTYAVSGDGQCGTLSMDSVPTGKDGYASITYTASTDDVECAVVGIDAQGGLASSSNVYQGSTQQFAPKATDTFPTELVADGVPTTFTTTFTNPTDKQIDSAQVTFAIFPGQGANDNVTADQVKLEYSTSGEDGPFADVELSGSTIDAGAIQGTIGDPRAMMVPVGVDVGAALTLTYRLTLDESVPTDGSKPLIGFEAYLDQVNQATGAGTTLADTGSTDAVVTAPAATPSLAFPPPSTPETTGAPDTTEGTVTTEPSTTDSVSDSTEETDDTTDTTDDGTDDTRRPRRTDPDTTDSSSDSGNTIIYVLLGVGFLAVVVVLLVQLRSRRSLR
ncbi:MAG: hypothetical protein JWN62_3448 [Acidimicrobiales bacterium]|nr:hypothetical protein [Acidimicrobiales bacterium]